MAGLFTILKKNFPAGGKPHRPPCFLMRVRLIGAVTYFVNGNQAIHYERTAIRTCVRFSFSSNFMTFMLQFANLLDFVIQVRYHVHMSTNKER